MEKPKELCPGDTAMILMIPGKPVIVETFEDYPSLGRVIIKDMRETVAVGIVT